MEATKCAAVRAQIISTPGCETCSRVVEVSAIGLAVYLRRDAAKRGEGRGPTLHGRDETLLAYDDVRDVAVSGLQDEASLGVAPHRVKRIIPEEKECEAYERA
jgi:hypothetical protein